MNEIRIYFEGVDALRSGFRAFFREIDERAKAQRVKLNLVAGGSKVEAEKDFVAAPKSHPDALNVLLVDSDSADAPGRERVFYMVQVMEAWFLADDNCLAKFYGQGFNRNALKTNRNVEEIPKLDVLTCLKQATKGTGRKSYHKTRDAPRILEALDPAKVKGRAPNCRWLFESVLGAIESAAG